MKMAKVLQVLALVGVLVTVVVLEICQACATHLSGDENRWAMRSHCTPAQFNTPDTFYFAIDVPGVNRWVYWSVLKVEGLEKARPRKIIMAFRMANIVAFAFLLVALWATANLVLKNWWLAVLAVLPIVLSPPIVANVAFISWSGDIFLFLFLCVTLFFWLRFHLRGSAASWVGVLVMGALSGLATASKLTGVLLVVAYCLYLAVASKGFSRLAKPLLSCAIAFFAFCLVNPVMLFGGGLPHVVEAILARRVEVVNDSIAKFGPLTFDRWFFRTFFWWPLAPVIVFALVRLQKCEWFAPIAYWFFFLSLGILIGVAEVHKADGIYTAPLYLCVFFPVALMVLYALKEYRS